MRMMTNPVSGCASSYEPPKIYGINHSTTRIHSAKHPATSTPGSFDGPYLWINHDKLHMKARPNRHRVFTHVQRHYRPWKRSESSKSLRASAKAPKYGDRGDKLLSPKSVLAKGNSDPFAVYPVKIGPVENELITFYRDVFLPAQYGMRLRVPKLAHCLNRDWEDCVRGLTDEGIAHGSFARWGYMVSRANPNMHKVAMEHQYRSTQLLRKKVEQGHNLQTHNNYLHINMLYSAETISGNVNGALAHGRMFRSMFEEAWISGSLDYTLLRWQFHNDIQTSAIFLIRPVFDVDWFLPMVYAPLRAIVDPEIPPLNYVNDNIDPSIKGSLVNIFSDIRKFWELLTLREKQGKTDSASPEFFTWSSSQELMCIGRFMNHYIDIKHQLNRPGLTEKLKNQFLVQQYLTLAAVYLLKSLNHNPVVLDIPIFDCCPLLLPALRASLEESHALSKQNSSRKYRNARLWALYAGAIAEQAYPEPGNDPCRQWFNTHLAEHAIESGIYSWGALKKVLLGFLYSDRIPPNGRLWYHNTLFCKLGILLTVQSFGRGVECDPLLPAAFVASDTQEEGEAWVVED